MKYQAFCESLLREIGGKDNVISVTHCVTRLRFKLKDEGKANTKNIQAMKEVMQVIVTGGQYQVVVGPKVDEIYPELVELGGFRSEAPLNINEDAPADSEEKKGLVARFLVLMTGIFQPVLGMLMAGGMIKALLTLASLVGLLDKTSGTYTILSAIGDSAFYYLPIILGWTCAKKFGVKEVYGLVIGGCLTYPSIVALTGVEPVGVAFAGTLFESNIYASLFGIPVMMPAQSYAGSVIPIILIMYVASLLYKWFSQHIPAVVRSFLVPFLTLLISVVLGMIVIGPIAMLIQGCITGIVQLTIGINPGIAGLLLGTFWSVLVMFGLHMAVIPMFALNVATYGYDIINPLIFSGAWATMGAVLAVIVRTKSAEEREMAIPACFSTFFGVNEPSLYGVLIPRRKLMYSCFLSAGIGSMIAGFCGSKLYAFGASGPLGFPCFINPNGIDMGFIGLMVGAVVSLVLAFAAGCVLGVEKDSEKLK